MKINQTTNQMSEAARLNFIFAATALLLAVALGAFGAHGLESRVSEKMLKTWQTGVTYQFIHALSIFLISLSAYQLKLPKLFRANAFFMIGILFFSFNCYLYVLSSVKFLAMLVPLGGVSFLVGWSIVLWTFLKEKNL